MQINFREITFGHKFMKKTYNLFVSRFVEGIMIMCHMAYKGEGKVGQGHKKGTVGDVEDKCPAVLLFLHESLS